MDGMHMDGMLAVVALGISSACNRFMRISKVMTLLIEKLPGPDASWGGDDDGTVSCKL